MSSRTFHLTSPLMHGSDVKAWQDTLNDQLKDWQIDLRIDADGEFGERTMQVTGAVRYGRGILETTKDRVSPDLRRKIRNKKLTTAETERYHARAEWRAQLRKRYEEGPTDEAIAFARSMIGVTEHPAGSNQGPHITGWLQDVGINFGAPWCGAFANAVLMHAGFPPQEWLRYCPYTEAHAKGGLDGWSWHTTAKTGDLVLYGTSLAQHVGYVVDETTTIEGNTSSGPGGSQSNGGGVFERHRHSDGSLAGFPIRGYARPPYRKAA